MDRASYSPFPQYSWFGVRRCILPHARPAPFHLRQVNHVIFHAERARAHVRWIRRGRECLFDVPEHAVHFAPADGEHHVRIPRVDREHGYFMLLIPPQHLAEIATEEGCKPPEHLQPLLGRHDAVLYACLARLAVAAGPGEPPDPAATMAAARRLVLRLAELNGGGRPEWARDAGVFDGRSLAHLVECIDEDLRIPPLLGDMAMLVGLSPSHFARKFRNSTGLSLHRFVARRRVRASLALLEEQTRPIAAIALDLGFSSQSHFTRLFSDLTGMTPAKYRRQFRRTIG